MRVIKHLKALTTTTLTTALSIVVNYLGIVIIAAILVPAFAFDSGVARYKRKVA